MDGSLGSRESIQLVGCFPTQLKLINKGKMFPKPVLLTDCFEFTSCEQNPIL